MESSLVLASSSPRRLELLRRAGIEPEVRPADIPEQPGEQEAPQAYAARLARAKTLQVAAGWLDRPAAENPLVLGADTVVHIDRAILEKPLDAADGARILTELSDRWHQVTTCCTITRPGLGDGEDPAQQLEAYPHRYAAFGVTTRVRFRPLSRDDIERYLSIEEPYDKAGAYGIQGYGGSLVDQLEGSYTNVIGLPLPEVLTALRQLGLAGN